MFVEIPAWGIACMREKRMNTAFVLRVIEEEFGPVILLRYGIVRPYNDGAESVMVRRDPVPQYGVVDYVYNC
jgi:hypothetical protein